MEFNLREIFGINFKTDFFHLFNYVHSHIYQKIYRFISYILIGVTPTYLVKILFFLPARLNLPFVAPDPIFWLYTRDRQQGEILLFAAD